MKKKLQFYTKFYTETLYYKVTCIYIKFLIKVVKYFRLFNTRYSFLFVKKA